MKEGVRGRRAEAVKAAQELVTSMETERVPVESVLFKAQRLARLLRDQDAQEWFQRELGGYPVDYPVAARLGKCAKYVKRSYPNGKTFSKSLPALEAEVEAAKAVLTKMQGPQLSAPAENYVVAGATQQVLNGITNNLLAQKNAVTGAASMLSMMKAGVYQYAVDTLIALEFGDAAEGIFQNVREVADEFVRTYCPKAAEQLLAAEERLAGGSPEDLSAALTSCRRLLCSLADTVFPAQQEPYLDASGAKRKVGSEQYVNRLLAYLDRRESSGSSRSILSSQMNHLAARIEAVYKKACKGVHDDVSSHEAELLVLQTYILIAEIARLSSGDTELAAQQHVAADGPSARSLL